MSRPPWTLDGAAIAIPESIIEAIADDRWWARWFERGDWSAWRSFLSALFGHPLKDEALAIYRECTGRSAAPAAQAREAWAICGRRAGKTRVMATVAAWLACFVDWGPFLSPGERATIMVLAADRQQARTALRYLRSLIVEHPLLKQLVTRETGEAIELSCGTTIEVMTANFRGTRGYTVAAVLADEVAFWRDDEASANPAAEIFTALRPSMSTLPGSLLMVATTPYARRGIVFETWRRHWAKDGDPILVWRAPTRSMNASVPQATIDEALELDGASASAEYLAEFRSDIGSYIGREVVDAAVVPGRYELPPTKGLIYHAFVDPSGGSSDSMTLAIGHPDKDGCAILDAVRERRAPFSPEAVVTEFAELVKSYGVRSLTGDRWGGEFVREPFRSRGVTYNLAEKPKSDLYRDLLPILNSGKAELLDVPRLTAQLCGLERRTARSGRDSIDHAPGARDDIANAVAGVLVHVLSKARPLVFTPAMVAEVARYGQQMRMRRWLRA